MFEECGKKRKQSIAVPDQRTVRRPGVFRYTTTHFRPRSNRVQTAAASINKTVPVILQYVIQQTMALGSTQPLTEMSTKSIS